MAPKLYPPIPKDQLKNTTGLWNLQDIERAKCLAVIRTRFTGVVTCPFEDVAPDSDQAGIGDCGGFTAHFWATAIYFMNHPEDLPKEKIAVVTRTVKVYNNCTMQYQEFDSPYVMSPNWPYKITQMLEGTPWGQEGVVMNYVPKAKVQYGSVPWNKHLTPMDGRCAPTFYPAPDIPPQPGDDQVATPANLPPSLVAEGALHKIDGFAVISVTDDASWDHLLQTLGDNPGSMAIFATNLFDDYMTLDPNGFWQYHPGGNIAGSHAQWVCAVDFGWNHGEGCLIDHNSWGKAVQHPKISKEWAINMCGPFFIALGTHDADIGTAIYTKLAITTVDQAGNNVPCTFMIDGQPATSFQVLSEQQHVVVATPTQPNYTEASQTQTVTPTGSEFPMKFIFTAKPGPGPGPKPPFDIRKFIHDLIMRIERELGLIKSINDPERGGVLANIAIVKRDGKLVAEIIYPDGTTREVEAESEVSPETSSGDTWEV